MPETQPAFITVVDRNLALELVRVTEAAAIAASGWIGRGDKNAADGAAVDAMRKAFDTVAITGTVVIGEGEMDEAPMLYIGEKIGLGGPPVDIAVDPLEGTSITAKGGPNAIATVALAEQGGFLHAPDIYMDKIAIGPGLPEGLVDLDAPVEVNLRELARAKKCSINDLMVCILDRDRHKGIIKACRAAGARIMLIGDGDVAGVIAVSEPEAGVDMYMGSGGAPEGVLAAAALRCIGGQMQGRLLFENEEQIARATRHGPQRPAPQIQRHRHGTGRRDVRRDRRDHRADAARRPPHRLGRYHPFHRHAQQVRHRALRRGAPQLLAQAILLRLMRPDATGGIAGHGG